MVSLGAQLVSTEVGIYVVDFGEYVLIPQLVVDICELCQRHLSS